MEFTGDIYTIQAGDAAASYAGRGYNCQTHRWETISGVNLQPSKKVLFHLKSFQIWIYTVTTFTLRQGMQAELYIVGHPLATNWLIKLPGEMLQGGLRTIRFIGDFPLGAGCLWRVNYGGLVAGDRVSASVGYE